MIYFFFNDTATTEIYTLSLHDALPISRCAVFHDDLSIVKWVGPVSEMRSGHRIRDQHETIQRAVDRKSTRLNSSHPSRLRMPSSA